jgi:hypothetical protein
MKKFLPYLLGFILFIGLALLVLTAKKPKRKMDERITLKETDKIPYGLFAAKELLPSLFPSAKIYSDKNAPGDWDFISKNKPGQAVFLVCNIFNADKDELDQIKEFVRKGNYVFVISTACSYEVNQYLGIEDTPFSFDRPDDSLEVFLNPPKFHSNKYAYPGKKIYGHFTEVDSSVALVLGKDNKNNANFLQYRSGDGAVFINLAPAAFTNYFILYKNNADYYQQALSLIPANVSRIIWNEYYLTNHSKEKEPDWLGVLLKYESFRWALLTALFAIIIFLLMEMRRRRSYIPLYEKPKNETLDFVQTIGRLYYDKKDHIDLAKKMATYFLDHVREQYRLQTEVLDHGFISALHYKTGYSLKNLEQIVSFIVFLQTADAINEYQLSRFYGQLEMFYKNN